MENEQITIPDFVTVAITILIDVLYPELLSIPRVLTHL